MGERQAARERGQGLIMGIVTLQTLLMLLSSPTAAAMCYPSIHLLLAVAVMLPSSAAHAQTPPTCTTLLTADELTEAVGAGFADMGARDRGEGETECPWMLRGGSGGFKTVSVQFYDLRAVKACPNAPELDAFFEQIVAAGEGAAGGKKREVLAGAGQKAAFIPTDPQVLAVVQRADGVARIVGNNLTKAQITAVARAVATP